MSSPTSRSLAVLRERGCPLVQVVERWNPHARVRQDLFGIIDVLAIANDGEIIAVQATSDSNVSKRNHKIQDSDAIAHLRVAHICIMVHGWKKDRRGHWKLREVDVSWPTAAASTVLTLAARYFGPSLTPSYSAITSDRLNPGPPG